MERRELLRVMERLYQWYGRGQGMYRESSPLHDVDQPASCSARATGWDSEREP